MSIEISRLEECPPKNPNLPVKVTTMGNVIEVQYMTKRNSKATIRMLPGGNEYLELSTGEVKECIKHETRQDQVKSLYRTFKAVRGIINANVTDVEKVRWITLTYAENMTDTVRLKSDFNKFDKRFQYYCKKHGHGKAEYIVMMEPQGRGAWHCHLLYIFEDKAPYIPNSDLADLWKQGFVKIKKLDNVDNVGAYLTAYLGDMDVEDSLKLGDLKNGLMTVKTVEIDGESKYFIKGGRLKYYPANFNMYRISKGVKRPTEEMMCQEEAIKKVGSAKLTYEKTVILTDNENEFESIINTCQYNIKRL